MITRGVLVKAPEEVSTLRASLCDYRLPRRSDLPQNSSHVTADRGGSTLCVFRNDAFSSTSQWTRQTLHDPAIIHHTK